MYTASSPGPSQLYSACNNEKKLHDIVDFICIYIPKPIPSFPIMHAEHLGIEMKLMSMLWQNGDRIISLS